MEPHAARPSRILSWPAAGLFAVVGLAPLAIMFLRLQDDPGAISALLDERTLGLLGRTILLGSGAAFVALTIGLPFGFLVARTDVPGAGALRTLGVVPILVPPIMLAMTWTMVLDTRGPVMCALILGFATFPLVSLFTSRAAERIDARREEAARLVGGLPAVFALDLQLVLPAALGGALLSFIVAINDFALPDYVSAVGRKFNVYAGEVFSTWQVDGKEARAVATALPLVALTMLAITPLLLLRRRDQLTTIDGAFEPPARIRLGSWRWMATLFCTTVIAVAAILPIGRLAYEAGGGPRVFSGVSIRRVAWLQGGGAAANAPGPTDPGATQQDPSAATREATVEKSQNAALLSAGLEPRDQPPPQVAPASMRNRAVDLAAPEVAAAIAAREGDDVSDAGGGIPVFVGNLRAAFARAFELSRESLASSLLIAFLTASICVPLALILGHAARRSRRGSLLQVASLLPLVVPATLFGIGTIVLWNRDFSARFYDSQGLVVLLFVGRFLGIAVLIVSGAVASYSPRLEESARLAGAGPISRLFRIVAPGIWPTLVGTWIAIFALSVRELDAAVLVPAANDTAMFRVFNAVHFGRDDFVSALALLVIFAILLPGTLWSLFARARLRFLP